MKAEKNYRGPCPCGSLKSYERCCQKWHDGETPGDAETLMRSRYTAYVLKLEDYLRATYICGRARRRFYSTGPRAVGLA